MRTRDGGRQQGRQRLSEAEKRQRLNEWRRLQRLQIEREALWLPGSPRG